MYVIKTWAAYGAYQISAGSPDLCLSPGWTGEFNHSTVKRIFELLKTVRARSVQWTVRFDHEPLATAFISLGLSHRRVGGHILDLEQDHERVFQRHNSTIRNQVRKALRRGVQIRSTCENEDIVAYQGIYSELAQEKNWKFIYPASLTIELVKFSDASRFIIAEYEGSVIGGGLFLRDGNSVYHLHGVAERKYAHLFPACAVIDAGIRWACEIGAEFFNMGTSGHNKSLAQFKSFWGSHLESDWLFLWENPIWRGASLLKYGVRRLLPKLMQTSVNQAGSVRATHGMPWSERAQLGELQSVCNAIGSERKNIVIHGASLVGAEKTLWFARKKGLHQPVVLDFGCGNGRMVRFFGNHGCSVLGVDITIEMLRAGRGYGLPQNSWLSHFGGLSIPMKDHSVDIVWICGVLKYTLFPPGSRCRHGCDQSNTLGLPHAGGGFSTRKSFTPSYADIAKEMYRVLKPGGFVANYEMFVDARPDAFTPGFEKAGFVTESIHVLRRDEGQMERLCEWYDSYRLPPRFVLFLARLCAKLRYRFDDPGQTGGFRDYFFVWRKP
jgi:SAM-dependent methyltransferase